MGKSTTGRLCSCFVLTQFRNNNFSFKCHRKDQSATSKDQSLVYAVNDITFHPVHGTFSTCGSFPVREYVFTGG